MQEWYNTLARTQNRSAETVSSTYKRQINNNSPYYQNQQGYVQNAPNQHQQVVFFAIMIFPVPEILYLIGIHTTSFWNIIIQRTSHDDLTEKLVSLVSLAKFVKWQKCKTALCDLTEKLLVSNFIGRPNLQIILEAKSMDESRQDCG